MPVVDGDFVVSLQSSGGGLRSEEDTVLWHPTIATDVVPRFVCLLMPLNKIKMYFGMKLVWLKV